MAKTDILNIRIEPELKKEIKMTFLDEVINILASNDILPSKYRNHLLEPKKV